MSEFIISTRRIAQMASLSVLAKKKTPNGLALPHDKAGVKPMGTQATIIDNAEARMKFSIWLTKLAFSSLVKESYRASKVNWISQLMWVTLFL